MTSLANDQWQEALVQLANASSASPNITQDQIKAAIAAGQGYTISTGKISGPATTGPAAVQLLNNNTAKTCLIYSIFLYSNGGAATTEIRLHTADISSGWTAPITPTNDKFNGTASLMTAAYNNVATTAAGTTKRNIATSNNTTAEVLSNGAILFLLPNVVNALELFIGLTVSSSWACNVSYLEF